MPIAVITEVVAALFPVNSSNCSPRFVRGAHMKN